MYSSLDKIDIVVKENGRPVFIQTDHRSAAQMDEAPELTTIFGLTRALNAASHDSTASVRFAVADASEGLREVAGATGAGIVNMENQTPLSAKQSDAPNVLADRAFAALAKRVTQRERLALDADGLLALERQGGAVDKEEDEIAHWTQVAELAAVTGEILRAQLGGHWETVAGFGNVLPFVFVLEQTQAKVNIIGRAERFTESGAERDLPSHLLKAARDLNAEVEGPALFVLKPSTWTHTLCEPMLPSLEHLVPNMPVMAFGHDQPNTFAYVKESKSLAELRKAAFENLAKVEVELQRVQAQDLSLTVVEGSFFAAEKILDRAFMRSLHARIGSPLLAASIPCKGLLFVTNGVQPVEVLAKMIAVTEGRFKDSQDGLTPAVFAVSDGEITGVLANGAPAKKRGFFARLFS